MEMMAAAAAMAAAEALEPGKALLSIGVMYVLVWNVCVHLPLCSRKLSSAHRHQEPVPYEVTPRIHVPTLVSGGRSRGHAVP